ncbi:hypothetical protein REPUB_Repub16aG0015800 [Reevesia pubescens]
MINITKSLQRGVCLTVRDGVRVVVLFKYERLPNICFVCGCLNHHESDCATAFSMKRSDGAITKDYGPWLSAEFKGPFPCLSLPNHKGLSSTPVNGPAMHGGVSLTGDA